MTYLTRNDINIWKCCFFLQANARIYCLILLNCLYVHCPGVCNSTDTTISFYMQNSMYNMRCAIYKSSIYIIQCSISIAKAACPGASKYWPCKSNLQGIPQKTYTKPKLANQLKWALGNQQTRRLCKVCKDGLFQ